jgi:hypothetical protein
MRQPGEPGAPIRQRESRLMPRIVQAKLIPWKPGVPKIHLQYDNGFAVIADVRSNEISILDAIEELSLEDRIELAQTLETDYAVDRTRH